MDLALKTENVGKVFSTQRIHTTLFRLLKKALSGNGLDKGSLVALDNINIEIGRGETIAVVGDNGAGKSTLLRLLAGLYKPSKGKVYVDGDVKLLGGLGIGMIDELSVEDNVYLYGTIYGLEKKAIREKFNEIVEWAEVQDFARAELRTLSSGMRARLAFSTLRHVEADILLMDEALVAGDKNFKEKCMEVFEGDKWSTRTFVIATHNVDFAKKLSRKTLWLNKGKQVAFGETEEVLEQYLAAKR